MGAPLNIYEMSAAVYGALCVCSDNNYYTFAVMEPKEDDEPKRRLSLLEDLEEIKDLSHLGLLKDISYRFGIEIGKCREEHGFGYRVMELTRECILMFSNTKDRKVN
jgi:hypothetical protein